MLSRLEDLDRRDSGKEGSLNFKVGVMLALVLLVIAVLTVACVLPFVSKYLGPCLAAKLFG